MRLSRIWMEVVELWEGILALDWGNIKEEVGDVTLFFQMWAFWTFTLDNRIWRIARASAQKFIDRRTVWTKIYVAAGLREDTDGSSANYRKVEKVIKRLAQLGINESVARKAYETIVIPITTARF